MKTKQLAEMIKELRSKKLDEMRVEKNTVHKGTLGALEVRSGVAKRVGNQNRNPADYKVTNEKKEQKIKKNQAVINTEPETISTFTGY